MEGNKFSKLCKDSGLLVKGVTSTEIDIIFAKVVPKGERKMNIAQFNQALSLIAAKQKVDVSVINSTVLATGGPSVSGTKGGLDVTRAHLDSFLRWHLYLVVVIL